MATKTVAATYEDGILKLDDPLSLGPRSRVRVQIEFPEAEEHAADASLRSRKLALPADRQELLERIRGLRARIPRVDFDIVGALRDIRENG